MRLARNVSRALGLAAGAGAAWSLFEAQWVELKELDVPIEGLPAELDGFRVLHLSDFHLGTISFNGRALRKATDWAMSAAPPECRGQSQGQSPTRGTRGHGSNVEDEARERAVRAGDFTRDVAAPDVLGGQSQG